MAASSASRELFTAGVRAVLHNWPVLQIAVDNGFGGVYGQQKADWMVDVLQQYFHDNADLQKFEVEDYISTLMDQEFDTVVDDGSLPQVSQDLLQMFSQWQQGALQQLQASITKHSQNKQRVKVTPTAPESDSGQESNEGDEVCMFYKTSILPYFPDYTSLRSITCTNQTLPNEKNNRLNRRTVC
uniref:Pre-rRNA-processing protein TSR2 homolog n=1 Tax=Neogobius melanostomus TaxID=47308 RepID=A0A8C6TQT6_9GOBI